MLTQIDFAALNAIFWLKCPLLDFLMPIITYLGSGGAVWVAAAVIMMFFKRTRRAGVAVGIALIAGLLLSTILLKGLVARERPFETEGALVNAASLIIGVPSGRFSFPSGHAVSSFSSATAIFMYHRKAGAAAFALAALIAFSRLYLYVHFPSDVIAGAVFGVILGVASVWAVNKIWEKVNERKHSKGKLSDSAE